MTMVTMRCVSLVCVFCLLCGCVASAGQPDNTSCEKKEGGECVDSRGSNAPTDILPGGGQGPSTLGGSRSDAAALDTDDSGKRCEENSDAPECKRVTNSVNIKSCAQAEDGSCSQLSVPVPRIPDALSSVPCAGGTPGPCPKIDPVVPGGVGANITSQPTPGVARCKTSQDVSGEGEDCKDDVLPQKAPSPAPSALQHRTPDSHDKTKATEGMLPVTPGPSQQEQQTVLKGDKKSPSNEGHEASTSNQENGQHSDTKLAEKGQQESADHSLDNPKDAPRIDSAKKSARDSDTSPPATDLAEDDSSSVNHTNGNPVESPARTADTQGDVVQSQSPSASTSTGSTEPTDNKVSNSPSTDKDQDTKNTDSSVSPVWVHAPLLLLALLAVTAV
ncbi:hypothetical protein DQ04_19891000 [Trypanosoma grayi]|uniref:hypothetical protein n=1 Tax=Trypanosoma grayi TaxID=71804 RepID=UPI0004F46236|nr:hypothetical protein DQ04_19891000 [Trypanosoma grayi]KEG05625.1 hypothetical protein DQ04_19891000 [Trypanosoma grayi]